MLKENKDILSAVFRCLDVLLIVASFLVAYFMRFWHENWEFHTIKLEFQVLFFAQLTSWLVLSQWLGLYRSKRFADLFREAFDVIKAIGLSLMVGLIPAFFFREDPISRIFLIYLCLLETTGLVGLRYTLRSVLRYVRLRGYNYRQVVIVGRNKRSEDIAKRILSMPEYGVQILGFVDSNMPNEHENLFECKMIGELNELERILRECVVDEIIVTLPVKSFYQDICKIIKLCEFTGVEIKIPTDLFNSQIAKSTISRIHGIEVIDFFTSPKMDMQIILKRITDVIGSAFLIVITLPVFIAICVIIKLTSRESIFFSQKRVGYNGRLFNLYKFRTMIEDAEKLKLSLSERNEMDGPVFKIKDDPRITKIGRVLRKTSLDELPQFINVLKGDMSLVGPRPPIPDEVCQYKCPDLRRLSMRPGITCLWQISGRNKISFEEWMKMDQQYIDQWSLWLDLKILLKTLPAILFQKGAY